MKKRLDIRLVEEGLAPSRERAKAIIMSGIVYINNQKADKPGQDVSQDDKLEMRGSGLKYVSRGGLKLEKAMESFALTLQDAVCTDIGASTGGFTDCMLQNGAAKVYAVDVGYGQLAWSLRSDPRVINLERTNIRHITDTQIPEKIDFISIDVSFISLKLVLPVAKRLLKNNCKVVCLVKPQFEAGRENVGKKGVVKDPTVHKAVLQMVTQFALEQGFAILGLTYSPVKGPEGNIEYLLYLQSGGESAISVADESLAEIVAQSHSQL